MSEEVVHILLLITAFYSSSMVFFLPKPKPSTEAIIPIPNKFFLPWKMYKKKI